MIRQLQSQKESIWRRGREAKGNGKEKPLFLRGFELSPFFFRDFSLHAVRRVQLLQPLLIFPLLILRVLRSRFLLDERRDAIGVACLICLISLQLTTESSEPDNTAGEAECSAEWDGMGWDGKG